MDFKNSRGLHLYLSVYYSLSLSSLHEIFSPPLFLTSAVKTVFNYFPVKLAQFPSFPFFLFLFLPILQMSILAARNHSLFSFIFFFFVSESIWSDDKKSMLQILSKYCFREGSDIIQAKNWEIFIIFKIFVI